MSTALSELTDLLSLVGERSSEKRRELLRRITDAYVQEPQAFDARQTGVLSEILSILAREMDFEVRRALAARIADLPVAPRGILVELANDEIGIARPILKDSLTLTDSDLSALARIVSQEHLEAIARRARVSASVSTTIAQRANDDVLVQLAENPGAELPRSVLEIMISRAEANDKLHKPLVLHSQIPPDLLNGLFFIVSSSLKRVILDRTSDLDPAIIEEAVCEGERRLRARSNDEAEPAGTPSELAHSGPITEGLLVSLAQRGDIRKAQLVLAQLSSLPVQAASRVMEDKDSTGLAIVCRSCRFEVQTFIALAMQAGEGGRSADATELARLYGRIPLEAARRVLRFWRVRQSASSRRAA